ncbi:MAG: aminopeptidase P family protein [Candidatus Omnitrophota bacterium]|nr:MAG: aminopeptidase P family protein [Candidatus Omnitrophota bacterium]
MNTAAINKLRQELSRHKLDAFLISKGTNVAYLSGFRGEGQLLITPSKKILLVDFRFKEEAEKHCASCRVYTREAFEPLEKSLFYLVKKLRFKRIGFEASSLSYEFHHKLKNIFKSIKLLPLGRVIEALRAVKNGQEIKHLKAAAALSVRSFDFARKIIRPGKKEAEIARELQYFIRKQGAEDSAFDIIVASGKRSSLPHAPVSAKVIKKNEVVLVDLGCRLNGYNSDLTRVVFLGKIRDKIKRVYEVVLRAQRLAIEAIKAGERVSEIDKVARQYIASAGLGALFGHALGHGIGREVHEQPYISPNNQDFLKENMVFTVEPGVYIPGLGGIRVEDMVRVTRRGVEVLTQ